MFAQTEASLRTRRDGGGLKESSSELVLRDYPVFMQMMWDGRVTKGLIWSFTFCLASAASVPTSDSSVLAPVSIFHNGCFVPNKTKELLSKGSSFVLLSSHKHLDGVLLNFSRHLDDSKKDFTIEAARLKIHWHMGFVLWNTIERILWNLWLKDPINFVCLSGLESSLPRLAAGLGASQVSVSHPFISKQIAKWDW